MARHNREQNTSDEPTQGNGSAPYQLEAGRTNRVDSHIGTVKIVGANGVTTFEKDQLIGEQYAKRYNVAESKKSQPDKGWRYFSRRPLPLPASASTIAEAKGFQVKNDQGQVVRLFADSDLPAIPSDKDSALAEISRWMDQLEAFDAASEIQSEQGGKPVGKTFRVCVDKKGNPVPAWVYVMEVLEDGSTLSVQRRAQISMRARAEQELREEHELGAANVTKRTKAAKVGEELSPDDDLMDG